MYDPFNPAFDSHMFLCFNLFFFFLGALRHEFVVFYLFIFEKVLLVVSG